MHKSAYFVYYFKEDILTHKHKHQETFEIDLFYSFNIELICHNHPQLECFFYLSFS